MDKLAELLKKMERGLLVPNLSIRSDAIENQLERRDASSFSDVWMKAFRSVEAQKGKSGDAEPRVSRLRELAYLQAFERWKSPDLAAYISDDFGLIGDDLAVQSRDAFVNDLLSSYLNLVFPVEEAVSNR